jgi:hypothetical protein
MAESGERPYAIVLIEPDDDVPAICGKIDVVAGSRVVLVAARGNGALERPTGMPRLLRHAAGSGKEVLLVSGERRLRARARQSKVRAYPSEAALEGALRAPPVRLGLGRVQVRLPPLSKRNRTILSIAGTVVFLALVAVYLLVPSAHVVVYPQSEEISETVQMTASPVLSEVDAAGLSVPMHDVATTLNLIATMPTTGEIEVEEETVPVVAEEDMESLRELARTGAEQQGFARLAEEHLGSAAVYRETLLVSLKDERFSARAGEPADQVLLEVEAEVTGKAILDRDVQEAAEYALASKVDDDSMLLPGSVKAHQGFFVAYRGDTLTFEAQARGAVIPNIDVGDLKGDLAGESSGAAGALLEERVPMVAPPEIDMSPWWARGISRYSWRIDLELRQP